MRAQVTSVGFFTLITPNRPVSPMRSGRKTSTDAYALLAWRDIVEGWMHRGWQGRSKVHSGTMRFLASENLHDDLDVSSLGACLHSCSQ